MRIYCCQCQSDVEARLTKGVEIYPHRPDLANLPFWKCDACKGYVGCHYKTKNPTNPLGNIASKELLRARRFIHALIDPVWKKNGVPRGKIYGKLSVALGYSYHTGEIKTVEEARKVYRSAQQVIKEVMAGEQA